MFKQKGPAMIQSKFPPAFPLKHQQKDMRLALALGDENAVSMPVAAAANEVTLSVFLWVALLTQCLIFPYIYIRKYPISP